MCKHCDCLKDDPRCAVEAVSSMRPQRSDQVTPETKVDCGMRLLQDEVRLAHELMDQLVDKLNSVMCGDFPSDDPDVTDQMSGDCEIACRLDVERRQINALSDKIKMVLRRLEV